MADFYVYVMLMVQDSFLFVCIFTLAEAYTTALMSILILEEWEFYFYLQLWLQPFLAMFYLGDKYPFGEQL